MSAFKKIVISVLLIAMVVCLSSCQKAEEPDYERKYNHATELIAEGKYAEAARELEGFGSYKEATNLYMYCRAIEAGENGNYQAALTTFGNLSGYRDSLLMYAYYDSRREMSLAKDEYHEPAEQYIRAAKGFLNNPMFRDSKELADTCYKSAYDYAKSLLSEKKYNQAVLDFQLLGDYQDSSILAQQASADALYDYGNIASAWQIYRELDAAYQTHASDYKAKYKAAGEKQKKGEYGDAALAFEELGAYEDSDSLVMECRYLQGKALMADGEYEKAIDVFESIKKYRDSETRITQASADILFNDGKLADAWKIYAGLADEYKTHNQEYEDLYMKAAGELEKGEFDSARLHYLELGSYKNSSNLAKQCLSAKADSLALQGQYPEAIDIYTATKETEKISECRYQYALKLLEDKKYIDAAAQFSLCTNYKDSASKHFETGMEAFEAGLLQDAFKILKEDSDYEAAKEKIYQIAAAASAQKNYAVSTEAYKFVGVYKEAVLERLKDYYRWGNMLYNLGDYDGSAEVFAALGDFSTAPEKVQLAGYSAAVKKMESGEYATAKMYLESLGNYKDSKKLLQKCEYELASVLFSEEKYQEALDAFTDNKLAGFENADHMIASCYYHLALSAEQNGKYPDAINGFKSANGFGDSADHILECSYLYAVSCKGNGELDTALEWFVRAEKHQMTVNQIENIIEFYELTEQPEKAEHARQTLGLIHADRALDDGRFKEAVDLFSDITDSSVQKRREKEAWFRYGETLFADGKYEEAVEAFSAAGDYEGAEHYLRDAWSNIGEAELAAGNYEQARTAFGNAGLDKRVAETWSLEGETYLAEKKYEEARAAFTSAGLNDKVAEVWTAEAEAYLAENKFEEARNTYTNAGLTEKIPDVWNLEGEACLTAGEYEKAKTAFNNAGNQKRYEDTVFAEACALEDARKYREAYDLFVTIVHREDVKDIISSHAEFAPFLMEKGNIITFGAYEQDNNPDNGPEPIEWIVIETTDDKAFLLSRYGIETKPYHDGKGNPTWEECTLRKWLNSEFFSTAFSDAEQKAIMLTDVDNGKDQSLSFMGNGNNTKDYVFVLGYKEAMRYSEYIKCMPSEYAKAKGAMVSPKFGYWILRSHTKDPNTRDVINPMGGVMSLSARKNAYLIRPAMWIKIK